MVNYFQRKNRKIASFVISILSVSPIIRAQNNLYNWDYAGDFHDGYATVMKEGKCGVIDIDGQLIVPFMYDFIWDFQLGRARVMVYNDSICHELKKVSLGTPSQINYSFYCTYYPFEENCKYGFIDKAGQLVVPIEYDYATDYYAGFSIVSKNGKRGLIDTKGNIIIPIEYDDILLSNLTYNDNQMLVGVVNNNKMGFFDLNAGKVHIPLLFDEVYDAHFSEGMAVVKKDGKFLFIDYDGKKMTSDEWDIAFNFNNGLAIVKRDEMYYLVNKRFEIVYTIGQAQYISMVKDDSLIVVKKTDNELAIISDMGAKTTLSHYSMIQESLNNYFIASKLVKKNKSIKGLIDENGNIIVPVKYSELFSYPNGFLLKKKRKCIYLDCSDNSLHPLVSFHCKEADGFYEGLARVVKKGKYGYIGKNGKVIIPTKYDYSRNFHEGKAVVMKNNQWGYIDTNGIEMVINDSK